MVLKAVAAGAMLALGAAASAAPGSHSSESTLQDIVIVGTTPVAGSSQPLDRIPGTVQTVTAADLTAGGSASLAAGLDAHMSSVTLSDTLADPFQPDILYRGFEASPVLGTPQGLAVYENGVRVNESFGDSVNWDLIPDLAIKRVDVLSSSPLYGLNSLGGALTVTMKTGFDFQGADSVLSTGSFDQRSAAVQIGANNGSAGIYLAARALQENGWRMFAHDDVRQFYVAASLRRSYGTVELSYARINNRLLGPGAAPVQSLAVNPRAAFTAPQATINNLDFLTLNAAHPVAADAALQSVVYFRDLRQTVANGNTSAFKTCGSPHFAHFLCEPDGLTALRDANGAFIPDISQGGTLIVGENNALAIRTRTWGMSLQMTDEKPIGGWRHQLTAGATLDRANTDFAATTEPGVIDSALVVQPSHVFVYAPEAMRFPAAPVLLRARTEYYGFYATDTFDLGTALALTLSGRYNVAVVDLADERGSNLTGSNQYRHFDPAAGATFQLSPGTTAFVGTSINNRTPTPSEVECSDPQRPCLLPSRLAGDPPALRQVIARTLEAGVRGHGSVLTGAAYTWSTSVFRTVSADDIYGIATSASSGFFKNIGATRRQGVEIGGDWQRGQWSAFAQFSFVDAVFRSPLIIPSPSNPARDADGNIRVYPGARLPGIPRTRLKMGIDYLSARHWTFGPTLTYVGAQFYHGDESNQNTPLPQYFRLDLHCTYEVATRVRLNASMQNVADRRYATYGLFGDPSGVRAPGVPAGVAADDPRIDNRFLNPAAPRSINAGITVVF